MNQLFLWLLLSCGGKNESPDDRKPVPPREATQVTATAAKNAVAATKAVEDGWGAVFWRNATAWKVGGGNVVVSPRTASTVRTSGEALTCGGIATKGTPSHASIALPEGSAIPEVIKSPAIQAHRIERAAWRLDEVLPPRGRFAPKATSKQPSVQRGVEVGSVTKTRRYGAPPVLISTGVRECSGAVIVTDLNAEKTLTYDRLPKTCTPLRVIPAYDYDKDGQREFAVFSEERVAVYRLDEKPGRLGMTKIGEWYCEIKS